MFKSQYNYYGSKTVVHHVKSYISTFYYCLLPLDNWSQWAKNTIIFNKYVFTGKYTLRVHEIVHSLYSYQYEIVVFHFYHI